MSATSYDLQKFAKTGVASAGMTNFDKLRALAMFGGYPIKTITGVPPLQFLGNGKTLSDYQIYGNMTQNGTPTPDDPIFPQECGEASENILNPYADGWQLQSVILRNGVISHTSTTIYTDISPFIEIEPGKEYSVCNRNSGSNFWHAFYDENKQFISTFKAYGIGDTDQTATAPANAKYLRCSILSITYSPQYRYTRAMVTQTASIPDDYIPYGYKIPITCEGETKTVYLDEPLRKIGNYADEVKSDGTAVRKIKKIVLDGTENWQTLWGVLYCVLSTAADTTWKATTVMCDRYDAKGNLSQGQGYPSHYGDCSITFRDYKSSLMIRDDRYGTDTAAYKSYLADQYAAGTPVTIWYVLAEDQAEAVTLPQIPTISGQNTLSFGTALQPSSVSITGHIKPVTS